MATIRIKPVCGLCRHALPLLAAGAVAVGAMPSRAADLPYPLACVAQMENNPAADHCAALVDGHLRVLPTVLRGSGYRGNVTPILVQGHWYYARRDGRTLQVVTYDNGPDDFVHGLCRGVVRGKVGFFNRRLQPVIAPRYDFAFPFSRHGRAEVCDGCREVPTGEQLVVRGGRWGVIDRHGRLLRPLQQEAATP